MNYQRHHFHLSPEKAIQTFSQYDLVLDCTDHPTSRYLISDACVLTGRPLVSASALKTEGQLIVLNNPPRPPGDPNGGPCYRCVFPKPPPADSVLSCGEGGIIGPVVGVMGVLQAIEAVKLITAKPKPPSASTASLDLNVLMSMPPSPSDQQKAQEEPMRPTLLIFSAYSTPQFRSVRMRTRHASCAACSSRATISRDSLNSGSLDYAVFCGITNPINILSPESRISASEFARLPRDGSNALIDVRDETQYQMCALRGSLNIPWTGSAQSWLEKALQNGVLSDSTAGSEYYVVCRFGNDSQLAAKAIADLLQSSGSSEAQIRVKDIRGGFSAWRKEVDPEWPDY